MSEQKQDRAEHHIEHSAPTILVGVGGGIAAYKAVELVSRLTKTGAEVHVAQSQAAQKFVTPLTFSAISGRRTLTSLFLASETESRETVYPHLYPATRADCFVLAPATADLIGKIAHGYADDIISSSVLSLPTTCRRFFCPAMNVEMWMNETVQRNSTTLEQEGWRRIGPDSGALACGMEGAGRMAEPVDIFEQIRYAIEQGRLLADKKVLILSGPTREHIDPIRFIGNPSSGKMGKALAEQAVAAGARVEFITGPVDEVHIPRHPHISVHHTIAADDMLQAATERYPTAHIVIYAAAVADYAPVESNGKKLPKAKGPLNLPLRSTPDIAATLNAGKKASQVAIGFALQTHNRHGEAQRKLQSKKLDGIVLNYTGTLASDMGAFSYYAGRNGDHAREEWGDIPKRVCAQRILGKAAEMMQNG